MTLPLLLSLVILTVASWIAVSAAAILIHEGKWFAPLFFLACAAVLQGLVVCGAMGWEG